MAETFLKGCRARNDAILKRGDELREQWRNGNRSVVKGALVEMEPLVAAAVVALIMVDYHSSAQHSIASYLREVA